MLLSPSSEILDRPPPHDLPAERGLLAAVVKDPRTMDAAARAVCGSDFHDGENGRLFDALAVLHDAGKPIGDFIVVVPALKQMGVVAWTAAMLAELFHEGIPSNASYYAVQIRRCAESRQQIDVASEILRRAYGDADPQEVAAAAIGQLESRRGECGQPRSMDSVVLDVLEGLDDSGRPSRGLMTGIYSVDESFGVMMPGELVVLAARTGIGKTSLAMQIALHNAKAGRSVLFVSLEMTEEELTLRQLCSLAKVNQSRVRNGSITKEDRQRLIAAGTELHGIPFEIWAPPRANTSAIRGACRLTQRTKGLDLLVVDYLGLVNPTDSKRPRHEQIGAVTADLKATAKELSIPVLALCQLNRDAEGKEPTLAMLRDSGSVEQDSDAVMFLHSKCRDEDATDLIIPKNRHGPRGKLGLNFIRTETRFE